MNEPIKNRRTEPSSEAARALLLQVLAFYDRGMYIDALALSEPLGPITGWTSAEGRVLAGRLANNLGAPRLGRALHWLGLREYPDNPYCLYYGSLAYWSRSGSIHAWMKFRKVEMPAGANNQVRADWLAMKAMMLAALRDFSRADNLLIDALELEPDSSWLHVQLCEILDRQDLHEEALKAAQEALQLNPWYRPAVQCAGHKLVQLRRDDEALALLTEATRHSQSGDVWCQLGTLQQELKRFDDAWHSFVEAERLWPLAAADSEHKQWLAGQRSDIAYHRGDYKHALELAREVDLPFYKRLVKQLEKAIAEPTERAPRVQLPVPFVRQHHETCAPATMTAIAQFWKKPIKHEEVVASICYEGTQSSDERRWAEENEFFAREFRITQQVADSLIRAGVPFTLNTVEPGSAHLQAIVGIDELRGSFLVQDPSERHVGEVPIDKLLERYQSTGPRGMVMIPFEELHRIEAIHLPDEALYDLLYKVERALAEYDRPNAIAVVESMQLTDAEHRLTLQAHMFLARYDGNQPLVLRLTEKLLDQFPDDANLQLLRLSCLNEFGRREQRIGFLREYCRSRKTHPMLWSRLASELIDDARDHIEAEIKLRTAIRFSQNDGRAISLYAYLQWSREDRAEALELYRIAASINEKDESQARSYFSAARYLHQTQFVLEWLEDRKQRFGARSSSPGRTLAWAYDQLERTQDAIDLLAATVEQHPDDGDLRCHFASVLGRYNRPAEAAEHLEAARGKTSEASYLRSAAALAQYQGNLSEARELYRRVQAIEPLDTTASERLLVLDMDLDGSEIAEQNLRAAIDRFPHSKSLRTILIQWLRVNRFSAVKSELDQFVANHPQDAWGQREAAIVALLTHDLVTARRFAEQAIASDPYSDASHYLLARVLENQGDIEAARSQYREAIRLNVDHEAAIAALIDTCDRPKERAEQLEFVYGQLERQTTFGDGVLAFREASLGKIEPDALLAKLERGLENRPDLWQCYSALVQQHMAMNQRQEAVLRATQAAERFPLLPRVWVDLALVHRALGDDEAELAALMRAQDINPHWSDVARELSETYLRRAEFEKAEQVLRRVLAADPRDSQSLASLADVLYKAVKKADAFAPLKQACLQEINYHWAWQTLIEWSSEYDGGAIARETATQLVQDRPLDARSHLRFAEMQHEIESMPSALAAIEKAISLDPRNTDAHVRKAYYLGRLHRWDEAFEACSPAVFGDNQPVILQMRRAYVIYRKGEIGDAIQAMQRALESDPDHYGAWSQLADWAEEAQRNEVYRQAAENMVRIDPHQPVPRGYLAEALLRDGKDRVAAIEQLETALRLSPSYNFATARLIELYLEDNLASEAERVLAVGGAFLPDEQQQRFRLQIAAHQSLDDESGQIVAINELVAWCHAETPPKLGPLLGAVDTFYDTLRTAAILRLNEEVKQTPDCEALGQALGRLLARTTDKKQLVKQVNLVRPGAAWNECIRVLLRALATFNHKSDSVELLQRHFGKQLKKHSATWSAMGSTLLDYGRTDEVISWSRDWQKQEGLSGTDLIPAVAARWEKFKVREARTIVRFALNIENDSAANMHHIWAGLDSLIHGNGAKAIEHAQQVNPHELSGWYPIANRILVAACERWPFDAEASSPTKPDAKLHSQVAEFTVTNFDLAGFKGDKLTHWIIIRIRTALARAHRLRLLAVKGQLSAWYLQLN